MNKETKNTTTTSSLPFILVSDAIIGEMMKKQGFICVNETDTMYTFINNGKLVFASDIDSKKVVYSNKLCI